MARFQFSMLLLLAAIILVGCPGNDTQPSAEEGSESTSDEDTERASDLMVAIPNAAIPVDRVLTGGQPTEEHLEEFKRKGFRTIINLRSNEELEQTTEREQVERLGIRFVHIPIAGPQDFTRENARRLEAALEAKAARPAVVHCKSGNRVGALFALKAFYQDEATPEDALEIGRKAGLTRLEPAVRQVMEEAANEVGPGD